MVSDVAFRRLVARVWAKGARAVAELLGEIATEFSIRTAVEEKLETYANIDNEALEATGGDRFPPIPLHEVDP